MSERVDFREDFNTVRSWGQSPLATLSGVGSSGSAILWLRQDTISEGGWEKWM